MKYGGVALFVMSLAGCNRGTTPVPAPDAAPADAAGTEAAAPPADVAPDVAPARMLGKETAWLGCGVMAAAITAVAHSADGQLLASGHADGRVTVVRVADGGVVARLTTRAPLERLALSADGQRVAVLGGREVRELALDGTRLRTFGIGAGAGRSLQYAGGPTPMLLAATEPTAAANVWVWNLSNELPVRVLTGAPLTTFTDQGRSLLQIDEESGRASTVPLDGGAARRFTLSAQHLTPSSDGTLVAGWGEASAGVRLSLFSAADGRALWQVTADLPWIQRLMILPAIRRLMVIVDGGLRLFDLDSGAAAGSFPLDSFANPDPGLVSDPAPDGRSLALVQPREGRLTRFSTADGSALAPSLDFGISDEIFAFAAAPNGRLLSASGGHGHTWILDPGDGELRHFVSAEAAFKPDFSADSSLFALAGDARAVFRMSDGVQIAGVPPPANVPTDYSWPGLVFSADGKTLASGNDGKIELYDLDGTPRGTRPSQARAPGVAFSADGRWMATSGPELYATSGDTRVWPRELVFAPAAGDGRVPDESVAFSPDGTLLAVSTAFLTDRWHATTKLVKVADGGLVRSLGERLGRRPSFSPDGSWILGGRTLVHLATDRELSLEGEISASTFLPDGRIAAATRADRHVRLYCPILPL